MNTAEKNTWSARFIIGVLILALFGVLIAAFHMDFTGRKGNRLGGEYDYNLDQLRKIDPVLILYQENAAAKIQTGLEKLRGIALGPENQIFVAGDTSLQIYSAAGQLIKTAALSSPARCLAVAEDGTIYAGLGDHIEVYSSELKQATVWKSFGEKSILSSLAASGEHVFAADAGNRVVLHYDRAGNLLNQIGRKDPQKNIDGFVIPSPYFDLAVAPDGLLRVVNPGRHRIEAYTLGGELEITWGKFSSKIDGFCGCCNPVNFAMTADGSYITCEKGLTRIKIYDGQGNFAGVVAGPDAFGKHDAICGEKGADCNEGGLDVAVDASDKVFILDPYTDEIRVFTRKSGLN